MASVNMSIRIDSELKGQAEEILSQLGMTMNGTINMFLHQIVRDRAVPLSLSLSTNDSVREDLRAARQERAAGYVGRDAFEMIRDIDAMIEEAERNEQDAIA